MCCASAPASVRVLGGICSPFVRDIRSCSPFMTAQWRMRSCGVEPLPKYTERHRMWRPYYYTEIHVIDKELTPRMVRHSLLQVRMGESERSVPQTKDPRSEAPAATGDALSLIHI